MKFRVTFHRIVSWWLVVFSVITILSGYAASRKWFSDRQWITDVHVIFKWSFVVLFLFHIIYTFAFVRFKGVIIRSPKKHPVRLVQQITKWLILVFGFLIIISGFSHYEWAEAAFQGWMPLWVHKAFDVGLIISIIIHTMVGTKIITKRNKIERVWIDVMIWIVGLALIIGIIFLEVTMQLH